MTAEFVIQGHSLSVSCSLGISIFPEHGADGETLIKNADAAMYSAKDNGRDNFQFFTDDMNAQVVERLTLENSLRLALDKKELFLVYQPQMDIGYGKDHRVGSAPALATPGIGPCAARQVHPNCGEQRPDHAHRRMGAQDGVLSGPEMARRRASRSAGGSECVGGPVSSRGLLANSFSRVLHETGLAPQYLELELTESLLLSNADVTLLGSSGIEGHGVEVGD